MLGHLAKFHEGATVVVIGTGPSCWALGQREDIKALLLKTVNIGINRGYDAGHPVHFQVSLDHIWNALLRLPGARANYNSITSFYDRWCKKHNYHGLTLLEWVYTFKDKLTIHEEVWRYFRLVSPSVPFVRMTSQHNMNKAPYETLGFRATSSPPIWGAYAGIMTGNNSALPAINLAGILGATRCFLLGVDMTPPNRNVRQWETGPAYYRSNVKRSFAVLAKHLGPKMKIINLNCKADLVEFQKAENDDHAVELLRDATAS